MPGRHHALLALVIMIAALAATLGGAPGRATAAGSAPELTIAGKNRNCDSEPATLKPDTCRVAIGGAFTVQMSIDKLAGLVDADGDTIAGWIGIQMRIQDTANLTFNPRPNFPEAGPGEAVNCADGISLDVGGDGDYTVACALGPGQQERVDTGVVFEVDYTCNNAGPGTVTMPNGEAPDSHMEREDNVYVWDGNELDVLTIDCAFIWDTTGDTWVSVGDIGRVVMNFGQTVPPAPIEADVDGDGTISIGDIGQVVAHFGEQAPP